MHVYKANTDRLQGEINIQNHMARDFNTILSGAQTNG